MPQADFVYQPANDAAGTPLAVSIFADRAHLRDEVRDDVLAAGLALRECGSLAMLLEGEPQPLGEVVLLDCPEVSGAELAALSRLDVRAARSGAHLVISTTVAALDDVFACCDQSNPQILVDPSRAERVIALGRVLARVPNLRLRELAEDDRLTLLRLTEQVGQIADRLERLGADEPRPGAWGAFRLESPAPAYAGPEVDDVGDRFARTPRPPLPDPRLVRAIIRQRQMRARFFDAALFADPAWDMLLDLLQAEISHLRVPVSSLCIAAAVPATTALRWLKAMVSQGIFLRRADPHDGRRVFVELAPDASRALRSYFTEAGQVAVI